MAGPLFLVVQCVFCVTKGSVQFQYALLAALPTVIDVASLATQCRAQNIAEPYS
jgi:hypothetical protein